MKFPYAKLFLLPVAGLYAAAAVSAKSRNKLGLLALFAGVALYAFTWAVEDPSVFELDGDVTAGTMGQNGHDWDQVYADKLNGTSTSGALALSFVTDKVNTTQDDIFQGGGSKDTQGLQGGPWLYTASKPQGKDDITHAYAAAYNIPNGCGPNTTPCHVAIYFGVDRYDNSGDATMGFWFFQDGSVSETLTKQGGGFKFNGVHKSGDLLIIADFTVGGSISTPIAYKWVGDDATGSLQSVGILSTSAAEAVVNAGPITLPWSYMNKSGQSAPAAGEFLEGGVDLNAIFGDNIPCFSTFMAETRSSQSPTATLSDFTSPTSFPLCGLSVAKSCNGPGQVSADGMSVNYNAPGSGWTVTVTNTGIGTLYNVAINDALISAQPIAVAASLAPHASVTYPVSYLATKANSTNPLSITNSATALAYTASSGGVEVDSKPPAGTDTCTATVLSKISITKQCDTANGGATLVTDSSGKVVVKVFFKGAVTNADSNGNPGQTALSNITLADYAAGNPTGVTVDPSTIASLGPGDSATYTGSYYPSLIDTSGVAGRFLFDDTMRVTSATVSLGTPLPPVNGCPVNSDLACAPVSCPICPAGVCPAQ